MPLWPNGGHHRLVYSTMETPRSQTIRTRAGLLPYPHPDTQATVRSMRGNKAKDTKPEVETRRLLHRQGLRFRKSYTVKLEKRRTRIDIAFQRLRLAVLIDGCFWHGCPEHGHIPKTNRAYWEPKLMGNLERDREVDRLLSEAGWEVMHFWSHMSPQEIACNVAKRVADIRQTACN